MRIIPDSRYLAAAGALWWLLSGAAAMSDEPVARWNFGVEETSKLTAHGGVHRDQPGPRPPDFPDFDEQNTAVRFDGSGAHYAVEDTGSLSPFDFTIGDAITLEAWVNLAEARSGENLYVIGKGRTHAAGLDPDNQNWALRVREVDGQVHISFLFATPRGNQDESAAGSHWHRWTSTAGFAPGSGWHFIAAAYRFGEPDSIRGWLDGEPTAGDWDMGGPTMAAPVVDDDAVWIGSSLGGSPSNSFRGALDEIAVWRSIVPDEELRGRFRRQGPPRSGPLPEVAPEMAEIPEARVLVTVHEGLAAHERWPNIDEGIPDPQARWETSSFAVHRLPLRYDDWGIRDSWNAPVLVRMAADVHLPPGPARFLLRTRGLSRLWVDGRLVAELKPHQGSSDGHEPVPPVPDPPAPGLRPVAYGDQETFGDAEISADGTCRVILEAIVGGKKLRAEPGEMCVAVATADGSFVLLQPGDATLSQPLELTDGVWDHVRAATEAELVRFDDARRRGAAASQNDYWERRHALARKWAAGNPAPAVPDREPFGNPSDRFLAARIAAALAAAAGADQSAAHKFYDTVLPVLSNHCFRCHGEREKGGLRLNSLAAALKGGDSGEPAFVPDHPELSRLVQRIRSDDEAERMPPNEQLAPAEIAIIEGWIASGGNWPARPVAAADVTPPPMVDDAAFLRRATLDTLGIPPSADEARAFLADSSGEKRMTLVDRLLADERFADHWVSYWQDVLAENPSILKPSLNNSGPFRYFLYESLRDDKPFDRMVTELIMMRGSKTDGGSAGFAMAADNDTPFAHKAQIIGSAFLGVELQCARCHDSPYHSTTQRDLYSLAAMLQRSTVTVPQSSTVPAAFFEKKARESLIEVTLQPGVPIEPAWPFADVCGVTADADIATLMQQPDDARERLAVLVTMPQNRRFARVLVNRVWRRLIGAGFVEPAHDWEGHEPSHPELLDWLAHEFVAHDFDLKHVVRLIMTSDVYQREPNGQNSTAPSDARFFAAPDRRRLTAEQIVDSLYAGAGRPIDVEEITFDPDGRRPAETMISLGYPSRAWMFAGLSNERDRPSLSLPRAQAVLDVLQAFGWPAARQNPRTDRETDPEVLQPGILANGLVTAWVTRASWNSSLADLAVDAASPDELVDEVYLRFLTRLPNEDERAQFVTALGAGFQSRLLSADQIELPAELPRLSKVSWSTHLVPEANSIKLEMERRARAGDPSDTRLDPEWRELYEDFVWSVINTPEFVWTP